MIKYRILKSKLLFLHHIATINQDTLATEVVEVQKELNLPGLYQKCPNFLVEAGVTNIGKPSDL